MKRLQLVPGLLALAGVVFADGDRVLNEGLVLALRGRKKRVVSNSEQILLFYGL